MKKNFGLSVEKMRKKSKQRKLDQTWKLLNSEDWTVFGLRAYLYTMRIVQGVRLGSYFNKSTVIQE